MFIEFFKHKTGRTCTYDLSLTHRLTQAKIVSEGKSCKAGANFPNIPKNFFI